MLNRIELDIIVNRINKMESYFDTVCDAVALNHNAVSEDEKIAEMYYELVDYYENGQWLKDYESDERGELPSDFKRGVLSQDALYDLLNEIDYNKKEIKQSI